MRCPNCYNEIPEGSKFCQACGAPIDQAAVAPEPPTVPVEVIPPAPTQNYSYAEEEPQQETYQAPGYESKIDNKAIGSLVCGIIGFFVFGLILGVVALVLGFQVRKTAPRGTTSRGMATAGIVLGIVDLLGYVFALVVCGGIAGMSGMM